MLSLQSTQVMAYGGGGRVTHLGILIYFSLSYKTKKVIRALAYLANQISLSLSHRCTNTSTENVALNTSNLMRYVPQLGVVIIF